MGKIIKKSCGFSAWCFEWNEWSLLIFECSKRFDTAELAGKETQCRFEPLRKTAHQLLYLNFFLHDSFVLYKATLSCLALTNASTLFLFCATDFSWTVFDKELFLSKASSFPLACLTGLASLGWMDLAGLTGFSSKTFLRSLPWRGHTCELVLLLGVVGSVNTRLASKIKHKKSIAS